MKQEEDFFKRQFPTSDGESKKKNNWGMAIFDNTVVVFGLGIDSYRRLLRRRPVTSLTTTYALYRLSGVIVRGAYHLRFLNYVDPETFTVKRLHWFYRFGYNEHFWAIFGLLGTMGLLVLGFRSRFIRTKYQKIFENVGLVTRTGDTPVLVNRKKLPHDRIELEFDGKGVSQADFELKKGNLASKFEQSVESVEQGKNPSRIKVTLAKEELRTEISYRELSSLATLPPYSFFVGLSAEGPVIVSIPDLPHLLLAGPTGTGKSVLLKCVSAGLLESSHIQMYFIDLKRGVELTDFKGAPNVKIVKTMKDAVGLLRELVKEMEDRFSYLEKNNLKSIDPVRDKKDRIVLAIDEASVLYTKRHTSDPEYQLANEARTLTDNLAKLSRAAGIHLIFATQKLVSEVLPTIITDNISGRACFKTESIPSSILVLGDGSAKTLPKIPGRAIWSFGNDQTIVQVPHITDKDILELTGQISSEMDGKKRRPQNQMVGVAKAQQNALQRDAIKKEIKTAPDAGEKLPPLTEDNA